MPFVRIDLIRGKSAEYRQTLDHGGTTATN
jgi:hypothetical protein